VDRRSVITAFRVIGIQSHMIAACGQSNNLQIDLPHTRFINATDC
jgi:hypothetical protein